MNLNGVKSECVVYDGRTLSQIEDMLSEEMTRAIDREILRQVMRAHRKNKMREFLEYIEDESSSVL